MTVSRTAPDATQGNDADDLALHAVRHGDGEATNPGDLAPAPADEVELVDEEAHNRPAAEALLQEDPVVWREADMLVMIEPEALQTSDGAGVDLLLDLREERMVPTVVTDHQPDPSSVGSRDYCVGLVEIAGAGLLDEDVPPELGRREGD
jgi:hypothetical protein